MPSTGVRDQEDQLRERVAEGKQGARKGKKKTWVEPEPNEFLDGVLLCFDNAVAKTGWCLLEHDDRGFRVQDRGLVTQPAVPGLKGYADTLERATFLALELEPIVMSVRTEIGRALEIVYETPSRFGYRTESALLAGLAVKIVAARYNIKAHGVDSKHMKRTLTGEQNADKATTKKAVERYTGAVSKPWNADIADAAALGLTHLLDVQ